MRAGIIILLEVERFVEEVWLIAILVDEKIGAAEYLLVELITEENFISKALVVLNWDTEIADSDIWQDHIAALELGFSVHGIGEEVSDALGKMKAHATISRNQNH